MPVFVVSLNTWPQVGFSRNRSIGSVVVGDHDPELQGFSTALSARVASPAVRVVEVDHLAEVDVGDTFAGDDQETARRASSMALRTDPAVPRGVDSVA